MAWRWKEIEGKMVNQERNTRMDSMAAESEEGRRSTIPPRSAIRRTATEDLRAANEELRAAYEELASMNEELRALNETLSADLESARKPLAHQVLPMIVLDQEGAVVDFTPSIFPYFRMRDTDRGRPISHLAPAMDYGWLGLDVAEVITEGIAIEKLIEPAPHHLVALRVAPRNLPHRGVEITFYDLKAVRRGMLRQAVAEQGASPRHDGSPSE